MNKEEFNKEIEKLNIILTSKQKEQLHTYYELLVFWNQKMNLTAIIKEDDVYLKHFYDSLTIVKAIDLTHVEKVLDVGSGAGFPGIVLIICFPHLKLDIIDANNKKILFLNEVVKTLELKDVNLIHGRCEEYALKTREEYDLVTARAVASLDILLELCLPFVKVNGYFIALKGKDENINIQKSLQILQGKEEQVIKFLLPRENSERTIIKIRKEGPTPKEYPRSYDKIKKKPLK